MMWIHPLLQLSGLLLSLYALYLGYRRFAYTKLGGKGVFPWKRHVVLGSAVMAVWLPGLFLGLLLAWWQWHIVFITGAHYKTALAMIPFIVFGYVSGYIMDKRKAKRTALPLLHGANNLILVLMALGQLGTGLLIIRDFILP